MNLLALAMLVSSDDSAADTLGAERRPGFGIATDHSSDPETALVHIQQQKFDTLIVDFDDQKVAEQVLRAANTLGTGPLSVALVAETKKVRQILSGGGHFVLYKPISEEAARTGLRGLWPC